MRNKLLEAAVVSLCLMSGRAQSQNPIIRDQFSADPTARVFDGKVYLYPSHDIPSPIEQLKEWFCMADYHVFSSEDLIRWKDHGVIADQEHIPWVRPDAYSLWAPDCVCKDGKYYFYFPAAPRDSTKKGFAIGVAVSGRPYGPFMPLPRPIEGINGIDPCVLTDKDGQSYIYWAGRGMMMAKLKGNMVELASEPVPVPGLPDGFKEGPFVFEREGKYYFTFPWVKDKTEMLAYCMGNGPMGPFEFKGVIMDESPAGCWTNHHSIVEYRGQWYLFYHHNDYSPHFDKNRSVRADLLFFNADGTIRKVTPTLRGVGITGARTRIQVDRYSGISPEGVSIAFLDTADTFKGWKAVFSKENAWLRYDKVNFGNEKARELVARARSLSGGTLLVRTGEKGGTVAAVPIPRGKDWAEIRVPIVSAPTGVNDLHISLLKGSQAEVDWISFDAPPQEERKPANAAACLPKRVTGRPGIPKANEDKLGTNL